MTFNVQRNIEQTSKFQIAYTGEVAYYKAFIATPTQRSDNGKATLAVNQLTNHRLQLNIDTVDN